MPTSPVHRALRLSREKVMQLPPGISPAAVRVEIQRIVESKVFDSAPQASRLLRYIVENTLTGNLEGLTEDAIAFGALGRRNHDPAADAHVRVEFRRLRDKLREYYQVLGRGDPIVISIPKGRHIPEFRHSQPAERHRPSCDSAQQFYLDGRRLWARRTPESLHSAKSYFERALAEDPRYAAAHAALADCCAFMAIWGFPPREVMPSAKRHALVALEIDPELAHAHALVAFVDSAYEWAWDKAEREFKNAIELDRHCLSAYCWYAPHLLALGRREEAIEVVRIAQLIDQTTSLVTNTHVAKVLYVAGKYDQALDVLIGMLDEDPHYYVTHWYLGLVFLETERTDHAITSLETASELAGSNPVVMASLGYAYAKLGQTAEAVRIADYLEERRRREYVPATDLAIIHASLGSLDPAFEWLEATPGGILPHRTVLQGQRLLIIRGHARVQARPQHFRRLSCLAKNVTGF